MLYIENKTTNSLRGTSKETSKVLKTKTTKTQSHLKYLEEITEELPNTPKGLHILIV
jgi:hypothetical protein